MKTEKEFQPSDRQNKRFQKIMGIDKHDYGIDCCEVCGKCLGRDGICKDCGLPTKKGFLNALKQGEKNKMKKERKNEN